MVSMHLGGNFSAELAGKEISNNLCTLLIHFVDAGAAVDLNDLVLLVVMLDNRHGGFLVNAESLLDTLLVIIISTTGLTSLQKSLQHDFLCRGIE